MVSSEDVALRAFRIAGFVRGFVSPRVGGEAPRVRILAGVIALVRVEETP
jgi:hypothetical protein